MDLLVDTVVVVRLGCCCSGVTILELGGNNSAAGLDDLVSQVVDDLDALLSTLSADCTLTLL